MNRIKKFYRDNEEMINSSLLIVCGIGCAVGGAIALREMHRADGLQINSADHFVTNDGRSVIHVYLENGTTKQLVKRTP